MNGTYAQCAPTSRYCALTQLYLTVSIRVLCLYELSGAACKLYRPTMQKLRDTIVEPTIELQNQINVYIGFRVPITVALPRYVFNELAIELGAAEVMESDHPKIRVWPDITFVPQAEYRV